MKHVWPPLVAAIALAGCAATPSNPSSAETTAAAVATPPPTARRICRRETVMGSVTPRRVCRTPEQVRAEREAAQRALGRSGTEGGDRAPGT